GKGLHVVIPIQPTLRWNAMKGFTALVQIARRAKRPFSKCSRHLRAQHGIPDRRCAAIFLMRGALKSNCLFRMRLISSTPAMVISALRTF
ncbi:MAG: hypothetical protein ABI612_25075, partial [Betaproteobacteria bacterium]